MTDTCLDNRWVVFYSDDEVVTVYNDLEMKETRSMRWELWTCASAQRPQGGLTDRSSSCTLDGTISNTVAYHTHGECRQSATHNQNPSGGFNLPDHATAIEML